LHVAISTTAHKGVDVPLGLGRYNSVHPQIEYETENNFTVGVYQNSLYKTSAYAVYRWKIGDEHKMIVDIGGVTGYAYTLVPGIRVAYSLCDNAQAFVMPAVHLNGVNGKQQIGLALGLQVGF